MPEMSDENAEYSIHIESEALPSGHRADPVRRSKSRQKRWLLVLLASQILFEPFMALYFTDFEKANFARGLLFNVSIYLWCRYDAAELRQNLTRNFIRALAYIPVLAFPVYLYRVRGYSVIKIIRTIFVLFFINFALTIVSAIVFALIYGI